MNSESKTDRSSIDSLGQIKVDIYLDFPHDYIVRTLDELPNSAQRPHYFSAARGNQPDRVSLQVTPKGAASWIGLFAGEPSGSYRTGVYTTADPCSLLVVCNGTGYVVDVRNPEQYQVLPISPVLEVLCATNAELLIMANYTDLLAWGRGGLQWRTDRVSYDGIRNLNLSVDVIRGLAWSPVDGDFPFALDLLSGSLQTSRD